MGTRWARHRASGVASAGVGTRSDIPGTAGGRPYHRAPVRFVTFDDGGRRRLGALLDGRVVDLPGLLGHPAFPTAMEHLVRRNGGTVLTAARAALARPDADAFAVDRARLLVPIVPASLRSPDATAGQRALLGPDTVVPWPGEAAALDLRPKLVAVLRRPLAGARIESVAEAVFGYTLLIDWRGVRDDGTLLPEDRVPVTLGPAITTPEDWEPMGALLRILVDGARWVEGPLDGAVDRLVRDVATASRLAPLEAGDAFASLPLATGDRRVPEGSIVELSLEGLGDLRVEVGRR